MTGVIAILLAALPPWGAFLCLVLGFLLTCYVILVIADEIEIVLVPARDRDKPKPVINRRRLGKIGMPLIIFVAGAIIWGIFFAIIYLAAQLRQVIAS